MTSAQRVVTRFYIRTAAQRVFTAFGVRDLEKLSKKGRQFGVISAYRAELSKKDNQKRHGELIADLQKMGHRNVAPLKSQWDDMETKVTHKEKSIFIPNIKFTDLIELGKKYGQDAVLYKDKSGTIGVYFKDNTAVMAYDTSGAMGITKSTDPNKDYSKGRGLSFGLNLVEDHKFHYSDSPIKPKDIEKVVGKGKAEPKSEASKGDFLKEMGDKKVTNPDAKGRKSHPQVKIRSLDWEHQKPHYDKWKAQHATA